jgi:hypothetical protein
MFAQIVVRYEKPPVFSLDRSVSENIETKALLKLQSE